MEFKLPPMLREEAIQALVEDYTESHEGDTDTLIEWVRGGVRFTGWDEMTDAEVVKDYYDRFVTDSATEEDPLWKAITEQDGFEILERELDDVKKPMRGDQTK
jgi:hypothetical protein